MLLFHEERQAAQREALDERRHTEIQLAIAKSGLLASGRAKLIEMFPQFVRGSDQEDDGPMQMHSDFDPEEAERIQDMIERRLTSDTGTLSYDDLFADVPFIDERARNAI